LEPTGIFGNVHGPYLPGGKGSHNALFFVAVLLGVEEDAYSTEDVLAYLKEYLEAPDDQSDADDETTVTMLGAAVRTAAEGNEVLRPLAGAMATLASTQLTGGALETSAHIHATNPDHVLPVLTAMLISLAAVLCDVVWRCWRPVVLKSHRPYSKAWSEKTSGYASVNRTSLPPALLSVLCLLLRLHSGTPLSNVPVWFDEEQDATLYDVGGFLAAWAEWQWGDASGEEAPELDEYVCSSDTECSS
jgi:hypothetical protein